LNETSAVGKIMMKLASMGQGTEETGGKATLGRRTSSDAWEEDHGDLLREDDRVRRGVANLRWRRK